MIWILSLLLQKEKIAGGLLFALPLTVRVIDLRYIAAIVCVTATFAAIQEGHYIRIGRNKNEE